MVRPLSLVALFFAIALPSHAQTIRAHITDRDTWQEEGGFVASNGAAVGHERAGMLRQNTELVKTFNQSCPAVTVTADKRAADYVVIWDHTDWQHTKWGGSQNQFTVYRGNGDLIGSGAAHKMPNAAKDICGIIAKDRK